MHLLPLVRVGGASSQAQPLPLCMLTNVCAACWIDDVAVHCALQINPLSNVNPDHLSYFRFVGRVLGLAVKHGQYVEGGFTMPLYKMLLGKRVSLDDMGQVDPTYHSSLLWILENDVTDVIENTFVDEQEAFGDIKVVELKPGGNSIPVDNDNKHEYVQLIVRHRLVHGIKDQVRSLKTGFNEVVPPHYMEMFDECELELIVCGLGEIDIDDWMNNTEYVVATNIAPACVLLCLQLAPIPSMPLPFPAC